MDYRITIERIEYLTEAEQRAYRGNFGLNMIPDGEKTIEVLKMKVTQEQFDAIRAAALKEVK